MIYSLHENVKYMRSMQSPYDARKRSYASDNPFESLALTNPELFNEAKLQALEKSQNLVKDFDAYFGELLDADNARFREFAKDKGKEWTDDELDDYQDKFNVSIHTSMYSDFMGLKQATGLSDGLINRMIFKAYIPDALSEEGCKKLIDIRIKQSQLLIDSLYSMLEMNYIMLSIDAGQAKDLEKKLRDPKQSDKAIEQIKGLISDPKTLEKFRMGLSNYDFRPLGGACVFIATGLDLASANPVKYIPNLFKYDAIVFGHGEYSKNERPYTPLAIWVKSAKDVLKKIRMYCEGLIKLSKEHKEIISDTLKSDISTLKSYIDGLLSKKMYDNDIIEFRSRVESLLNKMIEESAEVKDVEQRRKLIRYIDIIDYAYQPIISRMDIDQAKLDGKSATWVVQPISTLEHQNLTHIVDIVRALKKEGFNNILINACNPGGVKLPKDIINDPSITVTMGKYSVLKETSLIFNESFTDVKGKIKKAISTIKEAVSRIVGNCKKLVKRIGDILKDTKKDTLKDIEITYIAVNGTRARIVKDTYDSVGVLEKQLNKSSDTIIDLIDRRLKDDAEYFARLEKASRKPISEQVFSNIRLK